MLNGTELPIYNKMTYRKIDIELNKIFVFIFFALAGLTDVVNGIFVKNELYSSFSVGQFVRLLLILYLLLTIFKFNSIKSIIIPYVYLTLFYFIAQPLIQFLIHQDVNGLINDLLMSSRIFLSIMTAIGLYTLLSHKIININTIDRIIDWNIAIIPTSSLIAYFLGIANRTYGMVGIKGFFIAQNTLSVVLIILFVFVCNKVFMQGININGIIQLFITTVALVLIGTKSSLIFPIIIMLFYVFISLKDKQIKPIIFIIILTSTVLIVINLFFKSEILEIILRQKYFIDQMVKHNNNIFAYLVSGRNRFLQIALNNFIAKFSFTRLIFGIGEYAKNVEIASGMMLNSGYKLIEMDIFDLFFGYGLFGLILIVCFYSRLVIMVIHTHVYENRGLLPYIIALIFAFIHSVFGGHLLYEALPSMFLGIICSRLLYAVHANSVLNFGRSTLHWLRN